MSYNYKLQWLRLLFILLLLLLQQQNLQATTKNAANKDSHRSTNANNNNNNNNNSNDIGDVAPKIGEIKVASPHNETSVGAKGYLRKVEAPDDAKGNERRNDNSVKVAELVKVPAVPEIHVQDDQDKLQRHNTEISRILLHDSRPLDYKSKLVSSDATTAESGARGKPLLGHSMRDQPSSLQHNAVAVANDSVALRALLGNSNEQRYLRRVFKTKQVDAVALRQSDDGNAEQTGKVNKNALQGSDDGSLFETTTNTHDASQRFEVLMTASDRRLKIEGIAGKTEANFDSSSSTRRAVELPTKNDSKTTAFRVKYDEANTNTREVNASNEVRQTAAETTVKANKSSNLSKNEDLHLALLPASRANEKNTKRKMKMKITTSDTDAVPLKRTNEFTNESGKQTESSQQNQTNQILKWNADEVTKQEINFNGATHEPNLFKRKKKFDHSVYGTVKLSPSLKEIGKTLKEPHYEAFGTVEEVVKIPIQQNEEDQNSVTQPEPDTTTTTTTTTPTTTLISSVMQNRNSAEVDNGMKVKIEATKTSEVTTDDATTTTTTDATNSPADTQPPKTLHQADTISNDMRTTATLSVTMTPDADADAGGEAVKSTTDKSYLNATALPENALNEGQSVRANESQPFNVPPKSLRASDGEANKSKAHIVQKQSPTAVNNSEHESNFKDMRATNKNHQASSSINKNQVTVTSIHLPTERIAEGEAQTTNQTMGRIKAIDKQNMMPQETIIETRQPLGQNKNENENKNVNKNENETVNGNENENAIRAVHVMSEVAIKNFNDISNATKRTNPQQVAVETVLDTTIATTTTTTYIPTTTTTSTTTTTTTAAQSSTTEIDHQLIAWEANNSTDQWSIDAGNNFFPTDSTSSFYIVTDPIATTTTMRGMHASSINLLEHLSTNFDRLNGGIPLNSMNGSTALSATGGLLRNLSSSLAVWPVKHASVVEGDVILGGLMMVHSREDTIMCGPIMPQGGIQALEAMLYTLDQVNKRGLLPNISLGAHILDDCDKDSYGLEMAVDFIKGKRIVVT